MTIKIIHNRLLGGYFIVRGPHQTPLSGRFDSKEEAKEHLAAQKRAREAKADLEDFNYVGSRHHY